MDIPRTGAFELARAIKSGRLAAVEVLERFLERIERHGEAINAVVALDRERARRRARAADAARARGEDWGPLHGVPCTVKDALLVRGLATTGGDPGHAGHIPRETAIAVQRYIDAGAIVFGKTNVPFMSSDMQSYNDVYGTTRNPWHGERTCGGSSGGAAAALAAGFTPIELGSDVGGSIRTPCHFNGVYGHKPSWGIVPQRGHLPPGARALSEGDLGVVGPMGTCVDDLEQALELLAGPPPELAAAWSIELPRARASEPGRLRVAVWADDPLCPVDQEIKAAIEAAAGCLERLGATVSHSARPGFDAREHDRNYRYLLHAAIGAGMPRSVFESMAETLRSLADDDHSGRAIMARGIAGPHRLWERENERRLRFKRAWAEFFGDWDVLLAPCAFVTAFPHDHSPDMAARSLQCNGEPRPYFDLLFYAGLTLSAHLPATAVPVGVSSEGLPIGMQIAGDFLQDRTTLAVARILEREFRGFAGPAAPS